MALADNPREHILRMFEMEMRQNPQHCCEVFSDGGKLPDLPLDENELVFGVHNRTHFFTPDSLIVADNDAVKKVRWSSVRACTSQHGNGDKISTLSLSDGTSVEIDLQSFGPSWSSRISQLYHALISRWGREAFSGFPLLSISAFFEQAKDDYCIAPNLEPHPGLAKMRIMLEDLARTPGVSHLLIDVSDYDEGEASAQGVVIVADDADAFASLLRKMGAGEAFPADNNTRRKVGTLQGRAQVFQAVWD